MVSSEKQDRIKVGVRIRPFLQREIGKENVIFLGEDNQSIRISDGSHFIDSKFDYVFSEKAQQEDIFGFVDQQVKEPMVKQEAEKRLQCLEQIEIQEVQNLGIIPRSVSCLFDEIQQVQQFKGNFTVFCSFIQIYNEKLYDLLQDDERQKPLVIREDQISGIFVEGLSEYVVQNSRDCLALVKRGDRNRAVRQTKFNTNSSRSHTIFQLLIESEKVNKKGNLKKAKINLCDLAGSEKYDKEGEMKEGHIAEMTKINLSLTTLGKVISQLAKGQKSTHIPFRDSKLTRLLQDSLGGNCKTILLTMISPISDFVDESINTLKFADRAKQVMIRIKKNEIDATNDALIKKLQREIGHLKEILNVKKKGNQKDVQWTLLQLKEENERLRHIAQVTPNDVENLKKENKTLRLELQRFQLQSPTTRSTISTQDPSLYNLWESNLGSNQTTSAVIIAQHNIQPNSNIQQEEQFYQQQTRSYDNFKADPANQNISQKDLAQLEEFKIENQDNLKQYLVFEGRCQQCQKKPPCVHYSSAEQLINEQRQFQIQQQNIVSQSAQVSSSILSQKINNQLNRSNLIQQAPNSRSGISMKSDNFKISSISGRSELSAAGRMITKSQAFSANDQMQVRIRTRNNQYQSATGSVVKQSKEYEKEINRIKEIRKAEERLKTLEQIEQYKQSKLERELQALEDQRKKQEFDRLEQKKIYIEKRKHLEETRKKVALYEQNKQQKTNVLSERERLAAERKNQIDLNKKDRFEQQKIKAIEYRQKKNELIEQLMKDNKMMNNAMQTQ